jgi:hypothetical protein
MFIVRMKGGLGNQMFQYATARALAARSKTGLSLDTVTGFRWDVFRRAYLLHAFNIQAAIASSAECFNYPGGRFVRAAVRTANRRLPIKKRRYCCEDDLPASGGIESLAFDNSVYLDGYWQRHEYFSEIQDELRREFTLRQALDPRTAAMEQTISKGCSVAVHLRGLPGESALGAHVLDQPVLPKDYYRNAFDLMRSKLGSPRFFVFTDGADPGWMLSLCPGTTVVTRDDKEGAAHKELWLMSRCRHHIIANSTFSWWGAWLHASPGHIVLAPNMEKYGQRVTLPPEWVAVVDC